MKKHPILKGAPPTMILTNSHESFAIKKQSTKITQVDSLLFKA
ncbi:hypothetical protein Flavo103_34730 [Flavobacterium collinsii]|nr:hypothetical protein [Flavobacterium collinsii]GIQ60337.1 hypothetical protein Flavo103_34730 [Flavobacterium collinsii]